ncbi:hypothetical protein CROQUDRAFT_96913 [Cronartium quercuum f. sp. fusiforme G11]|uniref:Uncharacterized protein n=1 Tax=Cronartium quercuum f. sp. fusiforme G11 TaxID=708437 RepID=A0A9P6T9U5_9BASI|nr:hypothetical protein CROQUDRAFT_96913 [Cronartium quercuum f. sp. fusiforme G11]
MAVSGHRQDTLHSMSGQSSVNPRIAFPLQLTLLMMALSGLMECFNSAVEKFTLASKSVALFSPLHTLWSKFLQNLQYVSGECTSNLALANTCNSLECSNFCRISKVDVFLPMFTIGELPKTLDIQETKVTKTHSRPFLVGSACKYEIQIAQS